MAWQPSANTASQIAPTPSASPPPWPAHTHFVTTWKTTTANESITIPAGGATGTYTVNWGDETVSVNVTGSQRHTYDTPGTYDVRVYGDFTRIHLDERQPNANKMRSIEQWGDIRWESMNSAFRGASNMIYRATDAPDLSGVTDMSWMFRDASSFNGNISTWDVSSVTDMYYMFHNAPSFNQDLSTWDVSSVTDMAHMFSIASSFNGNISTWDVSSVTDMHGMFSRTSSFNQDLSTWDVSSATDMHSMFPLASSFNGNISTWDVSSATDMYNMFSYASSFNQDLSTWDVSSVTDMYNMFSYASSFNGNISTWDVSSVTDTRYMFNGASSFNQDLSTWDVSSVTDMHNMFNGATAFDQNLGNWYIVLDDAVIDYGDASRVVGRIAAQNPFLDGQNPAYGIGSGGDYDAFDLDGANLTLTAAPTKNMYAVNITSAGGFGSDNSRTINIEILGFSAPPTVQAGPDQTVAEGSTVRLNATDSDGDQLTYLWSHDSVLNITLANSTVPSTTFTAPEVSSNTTVTFTLTAADQHSATASDQVSVTIADVPTNNLPAAHAGPDQSVQEGNTVTLTGVASDPDGDQLTYLWSHDSVLNITLANSTVPSTTFTAPEVSSNTTVTFTFTTDDGTHASSDTLVLTIADTSSTPNTLQSSSAFVTTWQTTTDNESITIPVGGATGTYSIDWGDGVTSTNVAGDQTHTYDAAGTYTVRISGDFTRIYLNGDANASKLQSINQWGDMQWGIHGVCIQGNILHGVPRR